MRRECRASSGPSGSRVLVRSYKDAETWKEKMGIIKLVKYLDEAGSR